MQRECGRGSRQELDVQARIAFAISVNINISLEKGGRNL